MDSLRFHAISHSFEPDADHLSIKKVSHAGASHLSAVSPSATNLVSLTELLSPP